LIIASDPLQSSLTRRGCRHRLNAGIKIPA
jgi:hypothetical protein